MKDTISVLNSYKYADFEKGSLSIKGFAEDFQNNVKKYSELIDVFFENLEKVSCCEKILNLIEYNDDDYLLLKEKTLQHKDKIIDYVNNNEIFDVEFSYAIVDMIEILRYEFNDYDYKWIQQFKIDNSYLNRLISEITL